MQKLFIGKKADKCLFSLRRFWLVAFCIYVCAPLLPVVAQEPPVRLLPPLNESAPAPQSEVEGDYILQAGDEITVMDPSIGSDTGPYTTVVPVLPDGTVSIYPVGVLVAKGKTILQLNNEVKARAAEFVVNPALVLSLSRMRPVDVYVLGNVSNPGLYSVQGDRTTGQTQTVSSLPGPAVPLPGRLTGGPLTFLGATPAPVRGFSPSSLTVLTAIQMAGGVRENADIRHVVVRRNNTQPRTIDLWAMIAEGDASQDFVLRGGDVIVVPRGGADFDAELLGAAANRKRAVRIFGAIKQPGIYELTPRDDLISIISRAGGFTDTAITTQAILSRQDRDGQVKTFKLSVKKSVRDGKYTGRAPVMPGDVVEIRDSFIKKTAPRTLTIAATFMSAFFILYFSRVIVDRSQPTTTAAPAAAASNNNSNTTTTATTTNTTQ